MGGSLVRKQSVLNDSIFARVIVNTRRCAAWGGALPSI